MKEIRENGDSPVTMAIRKEDREEKLGTCYANYGTCRRYLGVLWGTLMICYHRRINEVYIHTPTGYATDSVMQLEIVT
jgi:hypothetical protein